MKCCLVSLAAAFGVFLAGPASAATINDVYWGGTPTDGAPRDLIGSPGLFDIDHMTVEFGVSSMVVTVFTPFVNNIGALGTNLGDLFISTDGWNPFGSAPYSADDASNGETWELAAVLDDHNGATSGNLSVYQVVNSNILLSNSFFPPGELIRENQEVQYNPLNQSPLYSGNWSIADVTGTDYDALIFNIDFATTLEAAGFGPSTGFHWAMTCANDAIEGAASAPVPEPMTVALLGSSLALIPLRRRRRV